MLLHLLTGFISLTQALSLPRDHATPATKDATLIFANDPSCLTCTDAATLSPDYLQAGNPPYADYTYTALMSFDLTLPASQIQGCELIIPAFTNRTHDPVTIEVVSAGDSSWDPETVDAQSAPAEGAVVASSFVDETSNLTPQDISGACALADEQGRVSIYIKAKGGFVAFWSSESGNPAILKLF